MARRGREPCLAPARRPTDHGSGGVLEVDHARRQRSSAAPPEAARRQGGASRVAPTRLHVLASVPSTCLTRGPRRCRSQPAGAQRVVEEDRPALGGANRRCSRSYHCSAQPARKPGGRRSCGTSAWASCPCCARSRPGPACGRPPTWRHPWPCALAGCLETTALVEPKSGSPPGRGAARSGARCRRGWVPEDRLDFQEKVSSRPRHALTDGGCCGVMWAASPASGALRSRQRSATSTWMLTVREDAATSSGFTCLDRSGTVVGLEGILVASCVGRSARIRTGVAGPLSTSRGTRSRMK